MKKQVDVSVAQTQIVDCFALEQAPTGRIRNIYTEAMFHFLGAFTSGRKAFKGSNINGKFYATDAIFRHHVKNGNIEKTPTGLYRITASGLKFFKGRRQMKAGVITDTDIEKTIRVFVTGETKDTPLAGLAVKKITITQ